jgi:DamX protein
MNMLETDNLTYSYQNRPAGSVKTRPAERVLITLERSQKLDLLIHLLANLRKPLIVSGPIGIGKTTLLNALNQSHKNIWPICILQGSSTLSFEAVISQLSRFLELSGTRSGFDLSMLRAFCEQQKVILVIDDAEDLVPGLINELMDFADSLKNLRLVFSMNYDEFHSKSGSDSAIQTDACHFIELPPLNQHQCLEYLQNLSAQPGALLSFNAITDVLVDDLYRRTQGIPGQLMAELPKLDQYQNRQNRRLGLWLGIILIISGAAVAVKNWLPAFNFQDLLPTQNTDMSTSADEQAVAPAVISVSELPKQNASPPALNHDLINESLPPAVSVQTTAPISPVDLSSVRAETATETLQKLGVNNQTADHSSSSKVSEDLTVAKQVESTSKPIAITIPPAVKIEEIKPAEKPASVVRPATTKPNAANSEQTDDSEFDWIQAQPAGHYTLQIMVLSSKNSASRFVGRYAQYKDQLKYYPIGREGQEKYVLIYGSFPSSTEALEQKAGMPNEFNQALVKSFKQIQKESRRKN